MLNAPSQSTLEHPAPASAKPAVDLSIVVPAYNEEKGIRRTVEHINEVLKDAPFSYEIVVVDDGSTDDTRREAELSGAIVIPGTDNEGYGAALKRGIAAGTSEFVAIIDADGTYPAERIPEMMEMIEHNDMVVGSRAASMSNVPMIRRPAKFILNSLANYLAQRHIPDLNSGLRVFRRKSLEQFVPLLPQGFSFTTTITLCMMCSNLRVAYLPIDYRQRIGKSKIRPAHFFAFILLVVRVIVLFNPLRVFLPLGAVLFVLGFIKFCYDIALWNLSESAVLAFMSALMIWSLGLIADMISRLHLRPNTK